jgi:hypothetical protein
LILAWPNYDPIVSKRRVLFANMSQNQVTSVVSLSTVCEPDLTDAKDCSELAIQILVTVRDSCSGGRRFIIDHSVCFQLATQVYGGLFPIITTDPTAFLLRLPVFGSSTLIRGLRLSRSFDFRVVLGI